MIIVYMILVIMTLVIMIFVVMILILLILVIIILANMATPLMVLNCRALKQQGVVATLYSQFLSRVVR